jgi:hypothetical protein
MKEMKLSPADLASLAGRKRAWAYGYLDGRWDFPVARLDQIASGLVVSVPSLFDERELSRTTEAFKQDEPTADEIDATGQESVEEQGKRAMAEYLKNPTIGKLVAIVGALPRADQEDVYRFALQREMRRMEKRGRSHAKNKRA